MYYYSVFAHLLWHNNFTMEKQFSWCLLRQFAKKTQQQQQKTSTTLESTTTMATNTLGDIKSCPQPYLSWKATAHLISTQL